MNKSITHDIPIPRVGDKVEHCGKFRRVIGVVDFAYKYRVWVEFNLLEDPGKEGYFEIYKNKELITKPIKADGMTLRELLTSLEMPTLMLKHPNLDKTVIMPDGPVVITDQDDTNIYLY